MDSKRHQYQQSTIHWMEWQPSSAAQNTATVLGIASADSLIYIRAVRSCGDERHRGYAPVDQRLQGRVIVTCLTCVDDLH